jgi:branched-chain amino acid aminotransferase
MGIESEKIWFDGELVPFADAKVHVLTHALHYGLGAFEGIRAYRQPDGRPGIWRLGPHIKRLVQTVKMLRLPYSLTEQQLSDACLDVLEANRFDEAYLRPLVFTGMGAMGLGARNNPVHTVIAAWQWGAYMGEEGLNKGIRAKTSSFVRHHPNAALQRAKVVGHYVNNILARYEASEDGYDEAILLDHHGFVAEGTGENLFVVRDGVVYTPPVLNILPGITRGSVIDILQHEGVEVREELFGRDALYTADEVFMCGTAAEITPVREVDRRTVGAGGVGPITQKVRSLYGEAVRGKVPWLVSSITQRQIAGAV